MIVCRAAADDSTGDGVMPGTSTRLVRGPVVPRPRLLWATWALLLLVVTFAAAAGSWQSMFGCLVVAALPVSRGRRHLSAALLASAVVGGLFAVAAPLTAWRVDAATTASFALVSATGFLRAWVLGRESTILWALDCSRVELPEAAENARLNEALWSALGTSSFAEGRAEIELAIGLLALAPAEAVPIGEPARRAFWINVYNVLARHAVRARSSTAWYDWLEPFRTVYTVAGQALTLDQIEHGLLRDNARPPGLPLRALRAGDARLRFAVPLDARVHFALRCGAVSCPPIRRYDGDKVDQQLELAARAFLAAESSFDATSGVVTTNRILSFYAADFGGTAPILALISRALDDPAIAAPHVHVRYRPYDFTWSHR